MLLDWPKSAMNSPRSISRFMPLCERRSEQVHALVDRARLQRREHKVCQKLFLQIADNQLAGAGADRFFFEPFQLLGLAQVRAEAHHLTLIIFSQPRDDDGSIESAAVSKNGFCDGLHRGLYPLFSVSNAVGEVQPGVPLEQRRGACASRAAQTRIIPRILPVLPLIWS